MGRKLPVGLQDFEGLRKDGYVYVDKSAFVHKLAHEGKAYFLSRPRRFGKSLLISALKYYWEGRRDLFEGLKIVGLEGNAPHAWESRPVFHLDFDGANYEIDSLEDALDVRIERWEMRHGLKSRGKTSGDRFHSLLEAAHDKTGHRCVVLVDEYDKPLLDAMEKPELVEHNRAVLKGFFSVLKGADEHLCFVFVTGVTKFSKVSIFSDLNNLRDISLSEKYAAVCGVTETELVDSFGPELEAFGGRRRMNKESCVKALRAQYDGYCFHPDGPDAPGDAKVYNPYSLLSALVERRLGSWWFQTGTPTFLVRRIVDSRLEPAQLTDGGIYATEGRLSDYRADDPDPIPLLYQAGYLTICASDENTGEYALAIPNAEVKWGLLSLLAPAYAPDYGAARGTDVFALRRLVEKGDLDGVRDVLIALFASIPYTRADDPFEHYFQAVIWLVFTLLGRYVSCEVHTARGRADCIVETRDYVYLFEFKRDGTAKDALEQIDKQGYAAPFVADSRTLYKVGCTFDSKTRQLVGWDVRG